MGNLLWISEYFWLESFHHLHNSISQYSEGRPFGGPKPSDGSGCPRCGFAVYAAEQMISKGNQWHKRCFNCADCHRSLDSTNLNDAPNGEIYWWVFGNVGISWGGVEGFLIWDQFWKAY
jgi:hypothetical protein